MSAERGQILFVDDEVIMLSTLRRVLRAQTERWDMVFESNPLRAIEIAQDEQFDVVVSDLRMPDLNGIEMIERLRQYQTADTEYILLTGNADLASAIDAINKTGVFRFLTKPCTTENLIEAVDVALTAIKNRKELPGNMATAALSAMSPAVAVVDADSRIVYYNDSAGEVLKTHNGIVIDRNGALVANCSEGRKVFKDTVKNAALDGDCVPKFVSLTDTDDLEPLTAVVTAPWSRTCCDNVYCTWTHCASAC